MSCARLRLRRLALASVSVFVVFAAGCATTSASQPKIHTTPAGPEQRFNMVGSGIQTNALISATGAQGPQINVGRFDDGKTLRGQVDGRVLDMSITGNRASGTWASVPLNLQVEEQADQLRMTGLIAGRPSTWTASREAIQGNIGFCAYDLNRQGDVYVGSRSCGRGIGQVTVSFPSTIAEWEPINIGVLMALLMATP
jgi:hypothetical protein